MALVKDVRVSAAGGLICDAGIPGVTINPAAVSWPLISFQTCCSLKLAQTYFIISVFRSSLKLTEKINLWETISTEVRFSNKDAAYLYVSLF